MLTRRAFLHHTATGVASAAIASAFPYAGAQEAARPIKVCFVSGSGEYKSDETLALFQKHLTDAKLPFEISWAKWKSETDLPGLEALDACDTMLLFTRRLKLEGDQLERIKKYCLAGKPIVGVRTASHAIQSWLELDREVLGGNYKGHYGDGPAIKLTITEKGKVHPILAGVGDFAPGGSLYKNAGVADDVEVLATGTIEQPDKPAATEPVAWTRTYKGARVFYTSLGHPKDFENAQFLRLLANALAWSAGKSK